MTSDVRQIAAPAAAAGAAAVDAGAVDLSVDLAGERLANPITTASGCFASGAEIDRFFDVTELGAVIVKSITPEPREGLPTPRMAETPSGMLNAIGLQNPGVKHWVTRDLAWLRERGVPTVASIAGRSVEDFREVARRLRGQGLVAVEVNLSCPNVEHRDLVFACDPSAAAEVIAATRRELDVPVFAKLTADVTDLLALAHAVVDAGANGLSLINTVLGMAIDPESGRPLLANTYGGLSGPAIRPIAVRAVYQVHQELPDVPLIGMGGIRTVRDVVEIIRAGATAVAIGTATFVDPFAPQQLVAGLRRWLADRGITALHQVRGQVEPWTTDPEPLP